MHQSSCNRRIHSAGESADNSCITHELANPRHFAIDERAGRPVRMNTADFEQEIPDQLRSPRCVRDLWMKLHTVYRARFMPERGHGVCTTRRSDNETIRWRFYVVTMAHPRLEALALIEPGKKRIRFGDADFCSPVFTLARAQQRRTRQLRDKLHSVADTQHGGHVEQCAVRGRSGLSVNRIGTAAQNY